MIAGGFTNKEVPQTLLQDAFQFMGLRDQDVTLALTVSKSVPFKPSIKPMCKRRLPPTPMAWSATKS